MIYHDSCDRKKEGVPSFVFLNHQSHIKVLVRLSFCVCVYATFVFSLVVSSVKAMDLGYGLSIYLRDFRPQLLGFPLTCEVRGSSLSVVRCLSVPHQSFVYVMLA